ncbi:D-tyrosyl-tRNA(Tyr) deacylase [Bulinus truncatus]|nr:D-tyrosyl-tRNA(Tyr) deacylase [Bulinus truncatus]
MKAVIQRVIKASVTVDDEIVGSIGRGLCVLVGISRYDTEKEMEYIVRKILNIRVFNDETDKRWMKSVVDMGYEVLCVSQFTLESSLKGNKPDFRHAMAPELSQPFYNQFLEALKAQYRPDKIQDGKFGAYMQVNIQNDGPVTIPLEIKPVTSSKNAEKPENHPDLSESNS